MKYPERMSRRGGGTRPFHSAIATTFSLEFAALEEVMLPQLMASGATNFLVIADERMASMSLSDGSQLPVQLGRDYDLFSPPVADGLFHPKIVLQIGRKAGRLFVGSANITAAGLAGNAETVVELECQDDPGPEREIIRSAWRYVAGLVPQGPSAARDALTWASERASWLAGPESEPLLTLDDGSGIAFLTRAGNVGIAGRFLDLIGADPVERLVVASPYWDRQLDTLGYLLDQLQPGRTTVLLDADGHEFPVDTPAPKGAEFRTFPRTQKFAGRFKHAKFVIASTATHDHVLVGSANCTTAAMGRDGFGGSNHEACLYRLLPRDRAIATLGLDECIDTMTVDLAELDRRVPNPPIPLYELASRKPGSFELEGARLIWSHPSGLAGNGRLRLLDSSGSEIGSVAFSIEADSPRQLPFLLNVEQPERASFVIVEQQDFKSHRGHIAHRGLLRRRRREVATGSLAKAVAAFNAGDDFDLWMHGAFEELARADLNDRPPPTIGAARPREGKSDVDAQEARAFSYEEFMEMRSPDARVDGHRDSSLTGTHAESVRGFLNMLVGRSPEPVPSEGAGNDWMDLGDEDEAGEVERETQRVVAGQGASITLKQPPNETVVDPGQFERMVRQYATKVTSEPGPLGPSDVLRVRFWLMMLLHKARHAGLPFGLAASSDEHGWPRMSIRVITAFFCGKRPPISRLMVAREYTEMPVDFLECWATVLWTLDAIESVLAGSVRHAQFVGYVRQARAAVTRILGLTEVELASNTVQEMREAFDRTLGVRLGLQQAT